MRRSVLALIRTPRWARVRQGIARVAQVAVMVTAGVGLVACASGTERDDSVDAGVRAEVDGGAPSTVAVVSPTTEPVSSAPVTSVPSTSVVSSSAGAVDAAGGDVVDDEVREAALAVQHGYLSDGVLMPDEYERAFNTFMACANDGGVRVEIRRVDPESGQILYSTWNEGKEIADGCYWLHFADVDRWFQTTNPVLLAREQEENRAEWRDYVVPCLERHGVDVPPHLDGTEITDENHEAMPFYTQYHEHLMAKTCE